ncbi:hypothetical protein CEXT_165611 [Caerostris extrusa]|uniref:Uncharacterized protein n=1 Tax=Caerostris extrusa TaxID=172846 RepID=A0AAV4P639_CAEEX|nr:hypothetical protein CEXT_165611 [Caerostris extrusa]
MLTQEDKTHKVTLRCHNAAPPNEGPLFQTSLIKLLIFFCVLANRKPGVKANVVSPLIQQSISIVRRHGYQHHTAP